MAQHTLLFSIFLIFTGAALLSTLALLTRQSLLVAYMLLGVLLGPWGLQLVRDSAVISKIGDVGIIFLLFLLGLHMPPQKLWLMLRKMSWVGLISSVTFATLGYFFGVMLGYGFTECIIIGAAMMFSSTIIGIKLLPTTVLHHQHTGEVMIGVLLLQDLIAILVLLLMHAATTGGALYKDIAWVLVGFPIAVVFAFLFERYVLVKLIARFNRIKEYMFLIAIAWCLSMAQLAQYLGLSDEIGAFIAGISIASSPIALYIAESLKPIRDFFLVLFFFSVGATFNLNYLQELILPAALLALVFLLIKPIVYRLLLVQVGESRSVSWEVGVRLGQISEFSLIIAYVGLDTRLLSSPSAYFIEAVTIISFIVSSYVVVMRYPTPVEMSDRLRRD